MPCVELGDVMRAATVGVVEASDLPEWPVGSHVVGFGGVCDYFEGIPGVNVFYRAGETGLPLTADLSICSIIIGLTAWYGVSKVLDIQTDDLVVVSGAAGAVGSIVGQLAALRGAKVLGIAGSAEKCAWLKCIGFNCAVNYKTESVAAAVKAWAPDGVTAYFDNVGGDVTDDVLLCMRNHGRVAVCGSISEYDDKWTGLKNANLILMRRLRLQGFICTDHMALLGEAKAELAGLVKEGKLQYVEDVHEGLETYPATVRLLFSGGNTGKLILKV
jgi:NADPH-dependent curcumin reductase CurA